ncbi:MAG: DNA repair protein RecN, partial [Propionibacteriaceae bacterium]|nr:DNA repair protein RecN [Propionibacteriaceae bacterium]
MLTELRIADLGVIAEACLEPAPGLTVVTGETGAGKTLVVTGLGLVAGGRSDAGLIRRGSGRAVVEARFAAVAPDVADQVAEAGGDLDGGELLLVRQVGGSRSRAAVGGVAVPNPVAARIGAGLVTIHGQSEQVRLASPARQRSVLDRAAGAELAGVARRYTGAYERRRALRAELADLRDHAQERAREVELLRYGLDQIGRVAPLPGEDAALRQEAERLRLADDVRQSAWAAVVALAGDDGDSPSALGQLEAARKALADAARSDPAAVPLVEQAGEVAALAADLVAGASGYWADLEADPLRLEAIAERLAELQPLTRQYGRSADEVIAWADAAATRLADLESSDDRSAEL